MRTPRPLHQLLILTLALGAAPSPAGAQELDALELERQSLHFDDSPQLRDVPHPEWFKLSFLNLPEDLSEALAAGKEGIMVYFGQKHCAYCKALLEVNFTRPDIVAYTRAHFDLIPLDIWSDREVVDMQGRTLTEKEFARREQTHFTPSIVFYDRRGSEVMRLRGYHPPYEFRAALEYVADRHYEKETFRDYLARAEGAMRFDPADLNEQPFFERAPLILDRSRFPGERPLAVFFEQGKCHACDVLHLEQLSDPAIRRRLLDFEAVQLDMWSDTPLVNPAGERTTAREWAARLGLFYAPTIVFFDQGGEEIVRIDSVVRFHRLRGVLDYVLTGAYEKQPYFQRWREQRLDSEAGI